jgi:hypothetical protein
MDALLAIVVICTAVSAHADRDIVYAARYFYPPGDRRISHYHVYRINPDGTGRTVLTDGKRDDYQPIWSPDGKQVMFLRAYYKGDAWMRSLCVLGAQGGRVKMLLPFARREIEQYGWSPDGRWIAYALPKQRPEGGYYLPLSQVVLQNVKTGKTLKIPSAASFAWSSDSKRLLAWLRFSSDDLHERIVEPDSGKTTSLGTQCYDPFWLDNRTLIGTEVKAQKPSLKKFGVDGKEQETILPRLPKTNDVYEFESATWLQPIPGDTLSVALGFKYGRTAYTWWRVDLQTKATTQLPICDHLAWSPDRRWFCGAPERELAPYGQGNEFVAPLYLYVSSGKRLRNLTPGMVYTEGADWRKVQSKTGQGTGYTLR